MGISCVGISQDILFVRISFSAKKPSFSDRLPFWSPFTSSRTHDLLHGRRMARLWEASVGDDRMPMLSVAILVQDPLWRNLPLHHRVPRSTPFHPATLIFG